MNNALFIIDPDGSQINCGVVRSVERVVSRDSIELPEEPGQVYRQYVCGMKSESFSFSLHCSGKQYLSLQNTQMSGDMVLFKATIQNGETLDFSGYATGLSCSYTSVDLQIQVTGRVTCESIRDINKMTNFEILEFLHRRLALDTATD